MLNISPKKEILWFKSDDCEFNQQAFDYAVELGLHVKEHKNFLSIYGLLDDVITFRKWVEHPTFKDWIESAE